MVSFAVPLGWPQAKRNQPYCKASVPSPPTSRPSALQRALPRPDGSDSVPCACTVPSMRANAASGTASPSARYTVPSSVGGSCQARSIDAARSRASIRDADGVDDERAVERVAVAPHFERH